MTEQYYTPTIEEFHVGFEFESTYVLFRSGNKGNRWKKHVLTEDQLWLWDSYKHDAHSAEFRIKYLDQKDIEVEGFEFDKLFSERSGANKTTRIYHKDIEYRGEKQSLMLFHNTHSNWVLLAIGKPGGASWMVEKGFQKGEDGEVVIPLIEITATGSVFAGTIKNISELRRILIQTKTS